MDLSSFTPTPYDGTPNAELTTEITNALWLQHNSTIVFALGLQAGLTLTLLLLLLLLTRPSKRRTAVFRLNIAALTCASIRLLCQAAYFWLFLSLFPVLEPYVQGLQVQVSMQPSQLVAGLFAATQACCIMTSLFLQVRAVSAPMAVAWKRRTVVGLSAVVALACVATTILFTAVCLATVVARPFPDASTLTTFPLMIMVWVNQAGVCFFSAVFVAKLVVAIVQRRRMGIGGFGAMEVVCIMGCQTMIVPASFTIIAPYVAAISTFSTLPMTLVTVFLPFSAIWAAETLPEEEAAISGAARPAASFRAKLFGSRGRLHSDTPVASRRTTQSISSATIFSWRRKKSTGTDVSVDEVHEASHGAV